jgi:hypothetical protein
LASSGGIWKTGPADLGIHSFTAQSSPSNLNAGVETIDGLKLVGIRLTVPARIRHWNDMGSLPVRRKNHVIRRVDRRRSRSLLRGCRSAVEL